MFMLSVCRKLSVFAPTFEEVSVKKLLKMAQCKTVESNFKLAEKEFDCLKKEAKQLYAQFAAQKIEELKAANLKLKKDVSDLTNELIKLENNLGRRQIPLPNDLNKLSCSEVTSQTTSEKLEPEKSTSEKGIQKEQSQKEKKKKATKEPKTAAPKEVEELPVDVGRLDLRVGKIVNVEKHPQADSLYVESVDCGEPAPRTVVSGLVKFVPIEDMKDRMVVILCNLKPAKMRGITSEAMVMCASSPDKVEVLSPPTTAVPGDLVHCDGYTRIPDSQLNPKKKIFETVAPDLLTDDNLIACYKKSPLHIPGKGNIVAQTLKNVNVK